MGRVTFDEVYDYTCMIILYLLRTYVDQRSAEEPLQWIKTKSCILLCFITTVVVIWSDVLGGV